MNTPFVLDKKSKITPVMQQWIHLKKQYPSYILFFRMGDFYEFFYDDANIMAKELDLKLTTRGTDDRNKPIPLAGIPYKAVEDYLKIAIQKKIPIAVAEQTNELQKFGSKEFFGREITQIITPGTVLNPELLSNKTNNYLSAIYYTKKFVNENKKQYGISFIDVTTGEFHISEYETKEEMLNQFFRFRPVELIISPEAVELGLEKDINNLVQNVLIFKGEIIDFNFEQSYNELISFFNTHSLDGFDLKDYYAGISSAGAIFTFLKNRNIKISKKLPQTDIDTDFLSIDLIARKNLELEQNQRDGTDKGTLLWVFDQTETAMGARKLRSWLRKPLRRKNLINERLDAVEKFYSDLLLREDIISVLQKSPDIERIATKLYSNSFNPKDALRLNEGLKVVSQLKEVLEKSISKSDINYLINLLENLQPLPEINALIDSAVIETASLYLNEGGIIKTGFDEELDQLRKIKETGNDWLSNFESNEQKRVNENLKRLGKKESKLKLSYTRGHGYYLELRSNLPVPENYKISRSLKDRTRYSTDELQEEASKILNADEQIKEREEYLFKDRILTPLKEKIDILHSNAEIIATLDVIITFAKLANSYSYTRPEISNDYNMEIINGRHPIVERIIPFGNFISNNTFLNERDRILIITGANMGGKSTYLRQVALISILAHMGSFVPAEKAKISILDRIFTRVGVVDDIWRGQSHFMVEMNETANVLNNASKNSLVILDEIGRGTSTNTGLAIATAVTEYLHSDIKCKTLFATHFHQLNNLSLRLPATKNYHVSIEYNNNDLIFLHKLVEGGTDESYGIEIAQLAGFPENVVKNALSVRKSIDEESQVYQSNLKGSQKNSQHSKKLQENSKLKYKKSSLKSFILLIEQQKILNEMSSANLEHLTAFEALNLIKKWKDELTKSKK